MLVEEPTIQRARRATEASATDIGKRTSAGGGNQDRLETSAQPPEIEGLRLDRMIGEGGFGQVWEAHREATGERVAVKLLHLELVRSVDALTRFQRELDTISKLQHANVVRALDHGTLADGRPYLVLEFIEGPSLREVIAQRGAIPPRDMLEIFAPLCDALATVHEAGFVHRDVKASNVILARTDSGPRPVLLDFGLVKLVDDAGPSLTSSRNMLGTPAAMAPEQMRGQPVDARTDVYALGLLAYHMLTGQPPFGGAPGVVQSYLQVHGPRPRPSSKVDIDPAIDAPIAKALAPDPRERFQTARELLDALRAVIAPVAATEQDVIAVYVEGNPDDISHSLELVRRHGMIVALAAPDSVLAVTPIDRLELSKLRSELAAFAPETRVAIGRCRASIHGDVVDGPALDVEGWAPYPLRPGLWVADDV